MSDRVSVGSAAAELGMELHQYISVLCAEGLLLVLPGEEDPRCVSGDHVPACDCGFIPSPHPSITQRV
jgi:hypothetical protein